MFYMLIKKMFDFDGKEMEKYTYIKGFTKESECEKLYSYYIEDKDVFRRVNNLCKIMVKVIEIDLENESKMSTKTAYIYENCTLFEKK